MFTQEFNFRKDIFSLIILVFFRTIYHSAIKAFGATKRGKVEKKG